ncbi:Putative gustatory receptor 28b [Trachymyrmex zeteki]|uniref:Gustatory receptor n=1 Tax=Mycetomoellerius zeteki TaxID=64791 RepID=A0A151XHI1_9HYME|nr:Putative gustatory receptor 28b [Trachymyrmex zeteki]
MCCGFIMIITHILSGPRMRLLQTILKISPKLPSKSYQKLSRFIHVKDILGTISVFVQICIYVPKTEEFNVWGVMASIFAVYCVLVVVHTNMLYINCVYVLKACFKNINDDLMHIQKLMVNDTRPSCVSMLIGHIKRILLIELKILKKRHLMLSNAVQMMNIVFSLQLLAIILMIFSITTFELYFYIVHWRDGILISFDDPLFDKCLMSIIFWATQMMLLVWICETGKNQAQQICTTIHDLLNNTSDKQVKDELQLFSLQLLHRDNTFSAKGLNVDATLFAAFMGSITTYMLILIQFLIMSHSCDKKSILHK